MLPSAQPTAGLLCRYDGINGNANALETQTGLDAAAVRGLASSVAQVPVGAAASGVICSCPNDVGSAIVVVLSYPGRSDVDLWIADSGCSSIANGDLLLSSCGNTGVDNLVSSIAAMVGE
jgi:hypothetical protein